MFLLAQVVLHLHGVIDLLLRADLLVDQNLAGEAGLLVGELFRLGESGPFRLLDAKRVVDLGARGEPEGDEDVADERLAVQFGGDAVSGGIELVHEALLLLVNRPVVLALPVGRCRGVLLLL